MSSRTISGFWKPSVKIIFVGSSELALPGVASVEAVLVDHLVHVRRTRCESATVRIPNFQP